MKLERCQATADEKSQLLPGDELIPSPAKRITHAVTIHAPVEEVWPWLAQIGAGRAGWYSYDRIDNGGVASLREIVPELQQVRVGDVLPAVPRSKDSFIVRQVIEGRALVLVVPVQMAAEEPDASRRMVGALRVAWTLALTPVGEGTSRLVSRGNVSRDWLEASAASPPPMQKQILIEKVYALLAKMPWSFMLPIAMTGHYVMESRMLTGIKARAERQWARAAKARLPV